MKDRLRSYCIIGDPIDHSLSPAIHNSAFNSLGLNSIYIAYRVQVQELEDSLNSLRAVEISGFNVTMPHKTEVIKYVDNLDSSADKANAINTVKNENGEFMGYNTDLIGFITPLLKRKINFSGIEVLIIGAGGACQAVVAALSERREISKVYIWNRNRNKADHVSQIGNILGLNCSTIAKEDIKRIGPTSHLIINTTPIGMYNEESLLSRKDINKDSTVYDIVYKPINTNLIKNAKSVGANIIYGYEMLLEQACASFKIWTGLEGPIEPMKKALFGGFGEPK